MAKSTRRAGPQAVVLADVPERVRLRELERELQTKRDEIAELDLEIEVLRETLADFEGHYHARLAEEHDALSRINGVTRHLERWADLLDQASRQALAAQARRADRRRQQELDSQSERRWQERYHAAEPRGQESAQEPQPREPLPFANEEPPEERQRLKEAYRNLARRYHPDLSRTEEERLTNSRMMARINALYKAGDLERLVAMAHQAQGAEIEDPELPVEEQVKILSGRLRWFEAVLQNLVEERTALERSPTCEMMRNVEQAQAAGKDLIDELKAELADRVQSAYAGIRQAVSLLENQVSDFNRKGAEGRPLTTRRKGESLQRVFDPFADKRLVRLGLDQLDELEVSRSGRQMAQWVEQTAQSDPAVVRLLLLTYCTELSPFPLKGLESYEDLLFRFEHLNRKLPQPTTLEEVLVRNDDLVEFGVRRATDKVVHTGLRFRNTDIREGVMVSLKAFPVRRLLREVLGVLSVYSDCPACNQKMFEVPLYRLRGIDHLRATVCPACGHTLSSYWMPKGTDVQAVLNQAYLDFELISEWAFTLGRASVAMQLVPVQVDALTVGDLKQRLVQDIFARHDIEISRSVVQLRQADKRVSEATPLAELDEQTFVVRFTEAAPHDEAEALEMVRHRIRTRFSRD